MAFFQSGAWPACLVRWRRNLPCTFKVLRVNTLNVTGKPRRQRTKQAGQSLNWKKAIVTLKEGDKIVLT